MVNVKPAVETALKTIPGVKGGVVYDRPRDFKVLPRLSFYEANNSPYEAADDREYLSEVNITVDIWAANIGTTDTLAIQADEAMSGIGFTRETSRDVPDPDPGIKHKTMRFQYIGG